MTDTPQFDFDTVINRREQQSAKWTLHPEEILPLWVADMDFHSPPQVAERLKARAEHGVFGYTMDYMELKELVATRMKDLYDWDVQPEEVLFNPGMVLTLNLVNQAFATPGDGVLLQTPVYGPFFKVQNANGQFAIPAELRRVEVDDKTFHYEIDIDAFERSITPQTKFFYLCNPHNPAGRVFTKDELEQLAAVCLKHNILIISDEIHSDLLMGDHKHIPIASLSPEISQQTITLIAPSKTFNLPGLGCSVAIVQDAEKRAKLANAARNMGVHVNIMGLEAASAAYAHGGEWLKQLLGYLTANRDFATAYIREHMPMLKTTVPEGTYLLWIDASELAIPDEQSVQEFFFDAAKVALSPGDFFGQYYDKYTRLNYGCSRSTLQDALDRMRDAVNSL
ncbi:MAG: MalY/PatB family protein [Aggregatilineales bacterium]